MAMQTDTAITFWEEPFFYSYKYSSLINQGNMSFEPAFIVACPLILISIFVSYFTLASGAAILISSLYIFNASAASMDVSVDNVGFNLLNTCVTILS